MNNSRREIRALDFKKLCKVKTKNMKSFAGFRIERDGVYLNRLDEATLQLLCEEEKRAVQGWHPTGRYHEPALRFPCNVDEFLNFVNESGLAGCIHGPTLSDWQQLTPPTIDTREPDKAPPQVETAGDEQPGAALSGVPEGIVRKRAALIAEFSGMWPSLVRDLGDSGRGGLSEAARAKKHGYWKVREALKWAAERGKIQNNKAEAFVRADRESEMSVLVQAIMLNQEKR
ncbi:MAG: hypothetical protein V5B38_01605 [Candidatus Accumulibacter propinquus]|jgi:hypothetical protein